MRRSIPLLLGCALVLSGAVQAGSPAPVCLAKTRACLQATAQRYLDGLLSHDGSLVPLARDVNRTENAALNARGEREVRDSFAHSGMVEHMRNLRFYVDAPAGEVVAFFLLDIHLTADQASDTTQAGDSTYKTTVHVVPGDFTLHEVGRFRIETGYIRQVEFIDYVESGGGGHDFW